MSILSARLPVIFIMFGLLLLPSIAASGVFHYERYYNMSGKYGDLFVSLSDPKAIWVEGDRFYISDSGANAVWVVNFSDAVIERIPTSSNDLFNIPSGIMFSGSGLYVANEGGGQVVASMGSSSYIALGPAISAKRSPRSVWVENNTLWMLDGAINQMLEYNIATGHTNRALFATGVGEERLSDPRDMFADSTHFYIADTGNNRVQIYDRDWRYIDTFGTGRGGLSLSRPYSVSSDDSYVYVADLDNKRVVVFSMDGYPIETLSGGAGGPDTFLPRSIRVRDRLLYVLDSDAKKVYVYSMNWTAGLPAVLTELDALNRSLTIHQTTVIDVMDRINLSHAPFGAPAALATAQALANSGQYLEASTKLAAARQEWDAVRMGQMQALRTELQKRIDRDWAFLTPYQSIEVSAEASYQRTVMLNRLQTAQERLNRDEYAATADVLLPLQNDLTDWKTNVDAWRISQNKTNTEIPPSPADSPRKAILKAQAAELQARLALMQQQAQALGQNDSSSDAFKLLIDSGSNLADVGEFADANSTLQSASQRLDEWQVNLDAIAGMNKDAANASATLAYASALLNQSKVVWAASGIDATPYTSKLDEAQGFVFSQPGKARQMALEVIESMKLEDVKVSTRGSAFGWFGLALCGVAIVGILAWALFRGRKNGLGG